MCEMLGEDILIGGRREKQNKRWSRFFKFSKSGFNYVIEEIYDKPIRNLDRRNGGNHTKKFKQYKVHKILNNYIGVYKIIHKNKIYIGSTTNGFRKRFVQHMYKDNKTITRDMLLIGAIFEIVWATESMDENSIRKIEDFYINKYRYDNNFELMNTRTDICFVTRKEEYITLRINKKDKTVVEKILKERNIDHEFRKKRSKNNKKAR